MGGKPAFSINHRYDMIDLFTQLEDVCELIINCVELFFYGKRWLPCTNRLERWEAKIKMAAINGCKAILGLIYLLVGEFQLLRRYTGIVRMSRSIIILMQFIVW